MKIAPLQLLKVDFKRIYVEVDERHAPKEPLNPLIEAFVFDGVNIASGVSIGEVDPDNERGRVFMLTLRVFVDNEPDENAPERQFSPYRIDVEAEGFVVVRRGAEVLGSAEDLAAVNGAAMLWSSIREQLLVTTSRMKAGPVTLPSVNFLDLKQGTPAADTKKSESAAPAKKSRTNKQA